MKAQDLQFTQLLDGSKQFIIPIFQRTTSWERSHCEQLWNDSVRVEDGTLVLWAGDRSLSWIRKMNAD